MMVILRIGTSPVDHFHKISLFLFQEEFHVSLTVARKFLEKIHMCAANLLPT